MKPEPIDVPGRGKGYPIQVGFNSNFAECKRCGMPVYFYKNPLTGKKFPVDPRYAMAEQDAVPGNDGIMREWIFCPEHKPLCEGRPSEP